MTATMAEALWWTAPFRAEIRVEPLPPSGPGVLGLRMLASGVSRGTERLVASGGVPGSEAERMRCPHQAGEFPFPVKYGYCAVAVVEHGPTELLGRRVFCLHPHQTRFTLPADAVAVLPDDLPSDRAVLVANMETALNALWDAAALPGQRIVVLGAGVLGCLVARLAAQLPGSEVTLVDPQPGRVALATAMGAAFASDATMVQGDADLVIEASGSSGAVSAAIALAGDEATVLVLGWHGAGDTPVALGGAFHSRRLRLVSTQVGMVAATQRPRWNHRRRLAKVIQLLRDPVLDPLITGHSPFRHAPDDLPMVLRDTTSLCHVLRYGET